MAFCGTTFADQKNDFSPTIVAAKDFNAETDCKVLYSAMKGFGTDEKKIINIVAYRSSAQLMAVQKKIYYHVWRRSHEMAGKGAER